MSDLIKRSDAIKVAKAFLSKDDDWFQEALASQIMMIPSADRPQGEWIPCSERLPSDYSDYLVIDGDGEMAVGNYRYDADAWDNGCFGWLERNEDDEQPPRLGKVVAWMPLPKPWKGADE